MEDEFIRVTPDKPKAKSILKMVDNTLKMINELDESRFPSNVVKEYYEVIRELASIIMLLDGYRVFGERAHKKLLEYIEKNCKEFGGSDISLMNELRVLRNRIAYDGFFVKEDYVIRKKAHILDVVKNFMNIIENRMVSD